MALASIPVTRTAKSSRSWYRIARNGRVGGAADPDRRSCRMTGQPRTPRTTMVSEPIQKTFISAQSLLQDSFELGLQIVRSGFRHSFLVGIWRGGAPIGITVQ